MLRWVALAFTTFVAIVWLNQGISLRAWKERGSRSHGALAAVRAPFDFLYRRALDEEMYFATASATFGQTYDKSVFGIRGETPLPPVDVPADGRFHAPYLEVPFEYPPPNVPFVLLPRLIGDTFERYARLFGALMGALLVGAASLAAGIASPNDPAERGRRIAVFGLLLLAHGALAIQRLDAIVALMLVLLVRAAIRGDDRSVGFWAGLVGATKIVPIVVAAAVVVAGGARPERLKRAGLGAAIGLLVGIGPMLVLAPDSMRLMLRYHGERGLHVESTLGVLYGATKAALGMREATVLDYGSFNFHGSVADVLAKGSPLLLALLVGVVLHAAYVASRGTLRESGGRGSSVLTKRVVLAALAATVALFLGGKVFSPQYLTWALPLVIAVPDKSWRRVAFAYGVVLVLTQLYYRGYYDHVYLQRPLGVVTVVARLAVLTLFFAWIVKRLRQDGQKTPAAP